MPNIAPSPADPDSARPAQAGASVAALPRAEAAFGTFGVGYAAAFVAVTFAAFLQAHAASHAVAREQLPALLGACLGYAALGTGGAYLADRYGTRGQLRLVVLVLLALGAYATLLSRGYTAMMLLATVSASVFSFGFAQSLAVGALCALLALGGFLLRSPLPAAVLQAEAAFASGVVFVYVFSRVAVRERLGRAELERVASDLALANVQLAQQADQARELATVSERNRIAREVHDGLGHYLTVIHVQLQAAALLMASNPRRARDAIAKAQRLAHEGLEDVRGSVALLRGKPLVPLADALRGFVERCQSDGVHVQLHIEGEPRAMPEAVHRTLARVAQEALTNVQRHAQATHVDVALEYKTPRSVRLTIRDDGVGASAVEGGYGLLGLRERIAALGGKIAVHTRPGEGFQISVEVPS